MAVADCVLWVCSYRRYGRPSSLWLGVANVEKGKSQVGDGGCVQDGADNENTEQVRQKQSHLEGDADPLVLDALLFVLESSQERHKNVVSFVHEHLGSMETELYHHRSKQLPQKHLLFGLRVSST